MALDDTLNKIQSFWGLPPVSKRGLGQLALFVGKGGAKNLKDAPDPEAVFQKDVQEGPKAANDTYKAFYGPDGQYRYEIDDTKARVNRKAISDEPNALKNILSHPELYKAYPHFADIPVRRDSKNNGRDEAAYNSDKNEITLGHSSDDFSLTKSLLHEIQHAVQHDEGFSTGSNLIQGVRDEASRRNMTHDEYMAMPGKDFRSMAFDGYQKSTGEIEAADVASRYGRNSYNSDKYIRDNPKYRLENGDPKLTGFDDMSPIQNKLSYNTPDPFAGLGVGDKQLNAPAPDPYSTWINKPDLTNYNNATKDLGLTPQEQTLYMHHLSNLYNDKGVQQKEGYSTIYSWTPEYAGKFYSIPSVWDGKIITDRNELYDKIGKEGWDKYPSYNTPEEADDRYAKMHDYMEKDTTAVGK